MRTIRNGLCVAALVAACSPGPPQPVELVLNEESCSQCRMAVSQREFAAESVSPDGVVDYFDDIGCLAAWVRERTPSPSVGLFVVDYESGEWLDARAAFYLRSESIQTPMSYGLVAFAERNDAEASRERLDGDVLTWEELLRDDLKGKT